jgi:hypothetical protein
MFEKIEELIYKLIVLLALVEFASSKIILSEYTEVVALGKDPTKNKLRIRREFKKSEDILIFTHIPYN